MPTSGMSLGILLAIMFPIMQGNGVVINWEWSMIAYTAIVVGFVWTFLTHAVPNRKPITKIVGSIGGAVILGWLGIIGVRTQYRAQHPGIPMPAVVIQTFPDLPEGIQDSSHLRWNVLLIRNDNDIEIENFYGRIQLPEPIMTTIESNLPPGVAIDLEPLLTKFAIKGAGNRTNLVWQLLIDKLPPHKTAAISFLTTDEGDATN